MNATLIQAITHKRRLCLAYHGRVRLIEPQCYGTGKRGTELLRVHQLSGGHVLEPLFDVDKIAELVMLDDSFARPGPHYRRGDSAMKAIFAEL